MLHIRLDNVMMPEARKLTLSAPAKVLAESAAGDPLYAVLERPAGLPPGKVVVLTVDLDKSDLPLQTAFPIMMANLLNWFGGAKGELREALAAGSAAEIELPATKDSPPLMLRSPDGRDRPLVVPEGATKLTIGPLDQCGVWSVVRADSAIQGGRGSRRAGEYTEVITELACNLADRRESDLRPAEGLPEHRSSLAAGLAVRPIWYYLLATALLLTCWEWFLYQRRWID
jgi:hypothetical protein